MIESTDIAPSAAGVTPAPQPPFATECDLVMKGGITSGIVYPLAITEIAKAFRLRSIGGTSAGAIAAAAAAAAELGRQRHQSGQIAADPDGFATLSKLPDHLCAPAACGGGTKLLAFFKPKPELRAIFNALLSAAAAKGVFGRLRAVLGNLIAHHWFVATLAFLLGTLPLWVRGRPWPMWPVSTWIVAFAVLLTIAAVLWRAARVTIAQLPHHGFGFCSGMPPKHTPAPDEALTVWLAKYIDGLAGQESAFPGQNKPLTFGDLKAHGIDLQMMTTCLTMGRPFRLPFRDDEHVRENKQFLYKRSEFEALFPEHVVEWMVAHERPYKKAEDGKGPFAQINFDGFVNLPEPDDLPVVVATRMSLSFPLLLSAIPLYAIDFRKPRTPGETPERCWFTDGGVGSNFPIHFFDAPVPTRPTFGLDLGLADPSDAKRVVFPKDNGSARLTYWRRFADGGGLGAITGFLGAVINVAKDWNHETLSHLPGFRDRIGLIKLTEEEGGLNLTMPKDRIKQLTQYGREAGEQFVVRFGDPSKWPPGAAPSKMNWENHQLIRLRLMLASASEMAECLKRSIDATANTPQDYTRFFTTACGPTTYRFDGLGKLGTDVTTGLHVSQAGLAKWTLDQLLSISEHIADTVAAHPPQADSIHPGHEAPKPTPELKLRPRV